MRAAVRVFSLLSMVCCAFSAAYAQDVSGSWTGVYTIVGMPVPINFALQQEGTVVSGIAPGDSNQATILGDINGSAINLRFGFTELAYSFDLTGTTDGKGITGTLIDSNSISGVFAAVLLDTAPRPLDRATVLTDPPMVSVSNQSVTITLIKFKKPVFTKSFRALTRAKRPKGSFQYEVTIKGAERRKLVSKRNVVTAKNLKPGNYQVSYRVTALKDEKKAFSTKPSPAADFTIRVPG